MSGVRLLAGTRKGAFILTSDGRREEWKIEGPLFAGWEMYHLKGSPADPNRLYASQSSGWFGQMIQRSNDGGQTWEAVGNCFAYDGVPGTHQWYDGTQHPWEFKRVWHLEPSLTDPDTVYAGVEDAALFRSIDAGQTWTELSGLRDHETGPRWQPGAGGMCLHTILLDPIDPNRIFVAISAAGAFRTDDGGTTWKPINRGLHSLYIPDPTAEVGHCVHRIAQHPARPNVLFMQKHWDVMRSDDAGDSWHEVSGNLPSDFGFPIDVHAHEPELTRILEQARKAQELFRKKLNVAYFVLDGHFGNHLATQRVRQLGLHLISRMRSDASLWLEPTEQEKQAHPCLKYGARLDYKQLPPEQLCSEVTEDGYRTQIYHLACLHKEFAERLNIVIIVRTPLASGRVGHIILFSSDLSLSWERLVDYCKLRFQIEFTFRDAKQHFGLEDFMGVRETSVANGLGLSFFVGNVARYLLEDFRERCPGAGLSDLRSFYRGCHYLHRLLKMLPDRPDSTVCERLLEQMSALGSIHRHSRAAPDLERTA